MTTPSSAYLLFLLFAVAMVYFGILVVGMQISSGQVSPAMGVPMQYVYAAPVVGYRAHCDPSGPEELSRPSEPPSGNERSVRKIWIVALLFGSFALLLILRVPIGISLGMSSLVTIFASGVVQPTYLAQGLVTGADSFSLMAVPFFVLAGELMATGGISRRLLNIADAFLGRKYGGLALVTVVACMFFAAISGSGPATVAAIGGLTIPSMLKQGYDRPFAGAISAAAGSIGVIIPPSIPMVMYCVATGVSVGAMFMGGVIPGHPDRRVPVLVQQPVQQEAQVHQR